MKIKFMKTNNQWVISIERASWKLNKKIAQNYESNYNYTE